jgi:hypothetical protein
VEEEAVEQAATAAASPSTLPQSSTGRLEVKRVLAFVASHDQFRKILCRRWWKLAMPRSSMMSSGTVARSASSSFRGAVDRCVGDVLDERVSPGRGRDVIIVSHSGRSPG